MKKLILSAVLLFSLVSGQASACNDFQRVFGGCVSAPPATKSPVAVPFEPDFDQVSVLQADGTDGQPANDRYFATEYTAKWIMTKFGADHIEIQPAINNFGARYVFTTGADKGKTAFYRVLVFTPNTFLRNASGEIVGSVVAPFTVNAGVLADEYRRNPEKDFPEQHFVTGFPPKQGLYLSNAEQGVWRTLAALNAELTKQLANQPAPETHPAVESKTK